MLTFLLITGLVISLGLNVAALIVIRNLLKKIAVYEQWILEFKQEVNDTLSAMREIDKQGVFSTSVNEKGVFESDDLVGQLFKELITVMEKLNEKTQ
jgi:hypothetical protein